jgi:membrane-associated phospholipid phosphatase
MLLFIRKRPDIVWAGLLAGIVAAIISTSLKYFTGILRPPAIIDSGLIHITGPVLIHHSFPSGHTVTIFTLAGILIFYFRSVFVRISLIFLAVMVGISRIAVGVHWPADVLAGAALGILCATIGAHIVTRFGWKRARMIQAVAGFLLILATFYLLIFYDCKYPQAIYLQYTFTSAVLIAGTREYFFLLKTGDKPLHCPETIQGLH